VVVPVQRVRGGIKEQGEIMKASSKDGQSWGVGPIGIGGTSRLYQTTPCNTKGLSMCIACSLS
jgi:hypothetical protein